MRLLWLLPLALSACASPDPKLYTLVTIEPQPLAQFMVGPPPVVELRHVNIPGYLDRPEIVRSSEDYRVKLAQNERWSEPFGDLLQRTLTTDISRQLPAGMAYSDDGAITARPTVIVEVDIARLDSDGAGHVVLDAQFSLRGPDQSDPTLTKSLHATAPMASATTTSYAAAISDITGQLAAAIAAAVRIAPAVER